MPAPPVQLIFSAMPKKQASLALAFIPAHPQIPYHFAMPAPAPSLPADMLLNGLPPVIDSDIRILILGSFPGEASLSAKQYYAHPRNQFWPLLSAVLGEDLAGLVYPERLRRLLAHSIGLWDAIAACHRTGSLDAAIRNAQPNDFEPLKQSCPQLFRVCFNGKTSGRIAPRFAEAGFETLVLPSSSPANQQLSFEQKLAHWQAITR
jgi:double-stranded uracil-DNA glycosylase